MKNLPIHVLAGLITLSILALIAVQWMALRAGVDGAVIKSTTGALAGIATVVVVQGYRHLREKKRNGIRRDKSN